jgi:hypothetical protein
MNRFIALFLFIILAPNALYANEYYLKQDFVWKYESKFGNVKIKSVFKIKEEKKDIIENVYNRTTDMFLSFSKIEKQCKLQPLTIHIISLSMMNSEKYFYIKRSPFYYVVGRYFEITPAIYITPQAFNNNTEDLAHELAHYFYDMCSVEFISEEAEDAKIYEFEKYFLNRK